MEVYHGLHALLLSFLSSSPLSFSVKFPLSSCLMKRFLDDGSSVELSLELSSVGRGRLYEKTLSKDRRYSDDVDETCCCCRLLALWNAEKLSSLSQTSSGGDFERYSELAWILTDSSPKLEIEETGLSGGLDVVVLVEVEVCCFNWDGFEKALLLEKLPAKSSEGCCWGGMNIDVLELLGIIKANSPDGSLWGINWTPPTCSRPPLLLMSWGRDGIDPLNIGLALPPKILGFELAL